MTQTLLRKELHSLRPVALLIASVLALIVLFVFGTEYPDENPLIPSKWVAEDLDGTLGAILMFAIMIGAGLLVGERDHGTLTFLDGLPVSRTGIFAAKILAAVLVLSLVPVLGFTVDVTLGFISRNSLSEPFPWRFVWVQFGLQLIVIVYLVSLTTALSFLGRWFALVLGLLFWGYLWFRGENVTWVTLLDPHQTLKVGLARDTVTIPWRPVFAQLAASIALLFVGWFAFHALGDRTEYALDRIHRHRILRGFAAGIRMLAPVVWIAAVVKVSMNTPDDPSAAYAKTPLGESAFARRETARYEFLYRKSQEKDAEPLIMNADWIHDTVAEFFQATTPKARLVVDLASPVIPHAAGQTNWTKIRIPHREFEDTQEFDRILGHETAHVYIDQISDGRPAKIFRYARFLHEGLATYVEKEFFATEQQQAGNRRAVAFAWSRGRIPFEMLSDDEVLAQARNKNLVYEMGEVFVRALVATHGDEAPARLLRALARKDAPMGLTGITLWRDTMQAADLNFDRVVGAYEVECDRLVTEHAEFLAKTPRITAEVAQEQDQIVIRPKFEGTAPGRLVCQVHVDDPFGFDSRPLPRDDDGSFRVPRSELPNRPIRYMLGWLTDEDEQPLFEPWDEAPLP